MEIQGTLINVKNISCVKVREKETNGYIWQKNTEITIYMVGCDPLSFVFFHKEQKDELEKVLNELRKELL